MQILLLQGLKSSEMLCTFTLIVDTLTLTVYIKLNQILNLKFKMETNTTPTLYMKKFILMNHKYPIRYSRNSFKSHERKLKITDYDILSRGSHLWNELTNTQLKKMSSLLFSLKEKFSLKNSLFFNSSLKDMKFFSIKQCI